MIAIRKLPQFAVKGNCQFHILSGVGGQFTCRLFPGMASSYEALALLTAIIYCTAVCLCPSEV